MGKQSSPGRFRRPARTPMRHFRRLAALLLALTLTLSLAAPAAIRPPAASRTCPPKHWAAAEIRRSAQAGLIRGDGHPLRPGPPHDEGFRLRPLPLLPVAAGGSRRQLHRRAQDPLVPPGHRDRPGSRRRHHPDRRLPPGRPHHPGGDGRHAGPGPGHHGPISAWISASTAPSPMSAPTRATWPWPTTSASSTAPPRRPSPRTAPPPGSRPW